LKTAGLLNQGQSTMIARLRPTQTIGKLFATVVGT